MNKMPWFRLYGEIIDDEKLLLLAFEDRWHYIAVLACKSRGIFDRGDEAELLHRKLAVKLQVTVEQLEGILKRLADVGLFDLRAMQPLRACGPSRPSASVWQAIRERIFARDDYTCAYCSARGVKLECDHVVPVSRGGSHDDENLTTACFDCNRSKRDKLPGEWRPA